MATLKLSFRSSLIWLFVNLLLALAYTPLSDDTLRRLPPIGTDFDIHTGAILSPILIPRVPGTAGSQVVQRHFVDFFTKYLPEWKVDFQNSTSVTPVSGNKQVPFANIIISRDPPWAKPGDAGRLTLVAHYDSKYTPQGFLGAIDSAAPCAMIMHAARSVNQALTDKWAAMKASGDVGIEQEKGVQILFLDGEEAFLEWTDTDSLYGSRALAESLELTTYGPISTYRTALSSITMFVLLDLLGAADTSIPSYFGTTHWAYQNMAKIEERLRGLQLLRSTPKKPFLPDSQKTSFKGSGGIQDDHIPFLRQGVEVLHIIPNVFPHVWHTLDDDGAHLDMPTVEDWAQIVTAFVGEWMDLEGHFTTLPPHIRERADNGPRELGKTELTG